MQHMEKLTAHDCISLKEKCAQLMMSGDHLTVLSHVNKILEVTPEDAEVLFNKGWCLFQLRRNKESIIWFDKVLKLGLVENSEIIWVTKGCKLQALGKYKKALKCFDEVIRINPHNNWAYNVKADILSSLDRHEEALFVSTKAQQINPGDAQAIHSKANKLFKVGRYEEAIEKYDITIKMIPNFVDAYVNKAVALIHIKKYKQAIKYCNMALKIESKNMYAYSNKADALIKLGMYKKAIMCCNMAIKINPTNPLILNYKATAYAHLGMYKRAVLYYNKLLKMHDKSNKIVSADMKVTILAQKADVFDSLNKSDKYNACVHEMLNMRSNNTLTPNTRNMLDTMHSVLSIDPRNYKN